MPVALLFFMMSCGKLLQAGAIIHSTLRSGFSIESRRMSTWGRQDDIYCEKWKARKYLPGFAMRDGVNRGAGWRMWFVWFDALRRPSPGIPTAESVFHRVGACTLRCPNLGLRSFEALGGPYTKNALQHHILDHSRLFGRLRKSCVGNAQSQERFHIPCCALGNMAAYGNSFRAGCIDVWPRCDLTSNSPVTAIWEMTHPAFLEVICRPLHYFLDRNLWTTSETHFHG